MMTKTMNVREYIDYAECRQTSFGMLMCTCVLCVCVCVCVCARARVRTHVHTCICVCICGLIQYITLPQEART